MRLVVLLCIALFATCQEQQQFAMFQWGINHFVAETQPLIMATPTAVQQIVAPSHTSVYLDTQGDILACGTGQVGTQFSRHSYFPTSIKYKFVGQFNAIIYALDVRGNLYIGNTAVNTTCINEMNAQIQMVTRYWSFLIVLMDNGRVYATRTYSSKSCTFFKLDKLPTSVDSILGIRIMKDDYLFFLDRNSVQNLRYLVNDFDTVRVPALPDYVHRVKKIAAGESHIMALTDHGYLLCMGHNHYGQCGLIRDNFGVLLLQFVQVTSRLYTDIFAGYNISLAVDSTSKKVYGCGDNRHWQLGPSPYDFIGMLSSDRII